MTCIYFESPHPSLPFSSFTTHLPSIPSSPPSFPSLLSLPPPPPSSLLPPPPSPSLPPSSPSLLPFPPPPPSSPYSFSRSSSSLLTQHSWPSQGGACPVVGAGFFSLVVAVSLVRAAPLPGQLSLQHETLPPPAAAGGRSRSQLCDSVALKAEEWKQTVVLENFCRDRGTWRAYKGTRQFLLLASPFFPLPLPSKHTLRLPIYYFILDLV